MFFLAKLSQEIKFLTTLCFVVMFGSLGILWTVYQSVPANVAKLVIITSGFDVLIIVGALSFGLCSRIKGYEIHPDKVVVVRSFNRKEIPCETNSTARIEPQALSHAARKFGIGGFFSISGLFHSETLGDFTAYVSDQQNLVVVKTSGKTFVISPTSPEEFIAQFQRVEKVAA